MADPHELFADKVIHIFKRSDSQFAYGLAVAAAISTFLLTELSLWAVGLWFVFVTATAFYYSQFGKRLLACDRRSLSGVSTSSLALSAGLAGLGWGACAAFMPYVSMHLQLMLVLTLTAVAAASLPRMAALPAVHIAFMWGAFLPLLLALMQVFGDDRWMMMAVLLVIWGGLWNEARKAHADLSEIYSTQQSLEVEAVHDVLTGLPNRRAFDSSYDREWRRAQRMGVPISVIMIDVDFFKRYNDHYGHQAGDDCLTKVARVFAGTVRRSSDLVARYGGEEFVAVLFHTPQDDGMALAETLREAVIRQDIEHVANPPGVVTISLGGATRIPTLEETPESLLKAADEALYRAKGEGRNRVAWALDGCSRRLGD